MHLHPPQPSTAEASPALQDCEPRLRSLLLGCENSELELPPAGDLTAAVMSLANATRHKMLLPLAGAPAELALVRQGDHVRVSRYTTDATPEVHVLDRRVPLRPLLDACAERTLAQVGPSGDGTAQQAAQRLALRARRTQIAAASPAAAGPVERHGGSVEPPEPETALAFGYTARVRPGGTDRADDGGSFREDIHALLFSGTLWAHVRGRRLTLLRGPIMLGVQRMLVAVRALLEAWEAERALSLKLCSDGFHIGVRLGDDGDLSLTLGGQDGDTVTAAAMEISDVALPVLRLASELTRALVGVDRSQSRNLRVRMLRDEVRALRKTVRNHQRMHSFTNRDPDRLRIASGDSSSCDASDRASEHADAPPALQTSATGALRFSERWRVEVDGLDAGSTFLCGDRLIAATPRHTLALSRDNGQVLWAREGGDCTALMAGHTLLRVMPEGEVELCDVADGSPYAHAHIEPRTAGSVAGVLAGGETLPPVAVLTEGARRLVALDVRTGQPRWRFASPGAGAFQLRRAGRVLVVACGDGSLHALDVATGEVVWRFTARGRFVLTPLVMRDTVVALSGEPGGRNGTAYGLDLYSGRLRWQRRLEGAPSTAPIAAGTHVALGVGRGPRAEMRTLGWHDGQPGWRIADPGTPGACLAVDRTLVVNAPGGRLSGIDLDDGSRRWSQRLADPLADDVPRRLEPVLRGGALFVPSAAVHIVRPSDGTPLGDPLSCELVPDLLRVDERGWVYVAEESGCLAAYAPVPRFRVIDGGRS